MEQSLSKKEVKYLINHLISMPELLRKLNIEVKSNGVMFCPFHDNYNTPSAHYYTEQDGSSSIFCFYEHKVFTNVDLFKTFCPELDLNVLAESLFNKLSEADQKALKFNIENESTLDSLVYLDLLDQFKFGKLTYKELLKEISFRVPIDDTNVVMDKLYNLGCTDSLGLDKNKYVSLMKDNVTEYKYLSSFKVLNNEYRFPEYIISYLYSHGDCIMLPNIINGTIYSITLRNLQGEKQFLKIGNVSQFLYGMSRLSEDFHYGDSLLLVEGNFDCDFIKTIFPNTVASLTNALSNNHLEIISRLTNRVILAYDNDKAGDIGYYSAKKKLEGLGVSVTRFKHNEKLKDFGDLYDLKFKDPTEYEFLCRSYKMQLENLL